MQDGLTKDVESVDTRKSVPTVSHRPVSPSSKMWHLCYYKRDIEPMRLDSNVINWVESVKYLGVLLVVGGRKLSFEIQVFRRSFYAAFNNIRSHAKSLEELMQLSLCESYCLPLLAFAAGAVSYNKRQVHDLNVRWKVVYGTVFNFNRWESVKGFINGLGKLSLEYILKVHKVKFLFSSVAWC